MFNIVLFMLLYSSSLGIANTHFPSFLKGTWKIENENSFEHWDVLNNNSLKGFSYNVINEKIEIIEYLDIYYKDNQITYQATVKNQNSGEGIQFQLKKNDSVFIFENLNHDFPKKIIYHFVRNNEINVTLSDGAEKNINYKLIKQNNSSQILDSSITNPNYDIDLVKRLGADDYGMKSYILVILKTGKNNTSDKSFISEKFRGHLSNINKLVEEDKLIVAGPLKKNENNYRGIFILNVKTIEEAKELLLTDPAIESNLLDYELYNWYGSAALPEYLPYSDKIWKSKP